MTQKRSTLSLKGSTAPSTSSSENSDFTLDHVESVVNALNGWAGWLKTQDIAPQMQPVLYQAAELLGNERRAADRFAKELATLRETARNDETILNNEIERLRAGISACIEFTADSEVREMLEALLHGMPG